MKKYKDLLFVWAVGGGGGGGGEVAIQWLVAGPGNLNYSSVQFLNMFC